jgi:nicotinamidase-related amidase
MNRHEFVATREDCLLLIIDIQQAMLKVIETWGDVVRRVNQLTQTAEVLGIPILLTEQYSKGLGNTIPEVTDKIGVPKVFQKDHFSACLERGFLPLIESYHRKKIVVVGMETHVCVLQTGLDLIKEGYKLQLVADGVASRTTQNRDIAIDLFREAGAIITSAEIAIFQWARRANTEDFRKILPIVK